MKKKKNAYKSVQLEGQSQRIYEASRCFLSPISPSSPYLAFVPWA